VLERSFCSRLSVISPGLELAATLDQHNKEGNTLDLTVWDVASGSPIGTVWHVDATTEAFPLVWFSNDARFLFLRFYERGEKGPTPRLRAWDIADGLAELCTLDHGYSIHVSPDGKWIGRTTADGVDLFDTTGAVRGALRRPGDYSAGWDGSRSPFSRLHYAGATYSPDSRYLLVTGLSRQGKDLLSSGWLPGWVRRASAEGAVARLWRLDDAEEVAAFTRFRQAEFSPDGKTLATLHNDNRIRIWDVPPRKPLVLPLVVSAVMWLAILLAVRFGRAWLARRRITGLAQQTTAASHG